MEKKYNQEIFRPFSTNDRELFCQFCYKEEDLIIPLSSPEFSLKFKAIYREINDEMINRSDFEQVLEELRVDAYCNKKDYNLETRIFNDGKKTYYNLSDGKGTIIRMSEGKVKSISGKKTILFHMNETIKEQVFPNLKVKPEYLPRILSRHFNLSYEDTVLLSLYLVAAFAGRNITHHMVIFNGSKGSGKSQAARMIQKIVDPQTMELTTIPKSRDDIAIRLNSSYLVVLDNLSNVKKDVSDLLAVAITGGTYTKRALYQDKREVALSLRNLIVVTGIEIATKEADLLDRSLVFTLRRIKPENMKTEAEIWSAFQKDMPKILGACMKLYARAVNDTNKVEMSKTRMADSFELMVKVGRQLGYTDKETSDLIWKNQSTVNQKSIEDNVAAQSLILLMKNHDVYSASVTDLLGDLQKIAEHNHIANADFISKPNVLSRRLNEVKSNLEQEYGIVFSVHNNGTFREITIQHK